MKFKEYRHLYIWKNSEDLISAIYKETKQFPKSEVFGLTNQIRRASISIISNLAEGCGRLHLKDKLRFFYFSRGSLYEVESQVIISQRLNYIDQSTATKLLNQIQICKKLLAGFINYHNNKLNK